MPISLSNPWQARLSVRSIVSSTWICVRQGCLTDRGSVVQGFVLDKAFPEFSFAWLGLASRDCQKIEKLRMRSVMLEEGSERLVPVLTKRSYMW